MDRRIKRPDIPNRDLAVKWLDGVTHLELSIEYNCSPQTISNRLRMARKQFPDLPWSEPRAIQGRTGTGDSIKQYVRMNDGKPGSSVVREGSIIRSQTLRKRG